MKKLNENEIILHGEAYLFPICKLPDGAKKLKHTNNQYHIVATSEIVGNHHVVDIQGDTQFFENEGKVYMNSKSPTQIRCLHENRHDTIQIPAGTYEFGTQQEYDPFLVRLQNIRD
jgi:hypothetical protein